LKLINNHFAGGGKMATLVEIETALNDRIATDAPKELADAGSMWKEVPLRFYYGGSDQKVDLAIGHALVEAIKPQILPDEVWQNLRDIISPATLAKKAIKSMWLANLGAKDLED
jgi:hypothetical protein